MDKIFVKARAKVNLTLEILDKREDNYHNLRSVFQKINLYDEIWIYKTNGDYFELESNLQSLKMEDNIIYKAYVKLKEKYNYISGIKVVLNKKIPMEAGLAGGSTDCASFILAMNKLFSLKMSKNEVEELGKSLGADVVPCMYNKAVLAEGIGEKITKTDTNFKYYMLVVKPDLSCNTGKMYKKLDEIEREEKAVCTKNVINALENNNIELLATNLYNSFKEVVDAESIKEELKGNRALGALLSGSGSSVFGIFKNKEDVKHAYNNLKNKYKEVYVCLSYNSSKEEI